MNPRFHLPIGDCSKRAVHPAGLQALLFTRHAGICLLLSALLLLPACTGASSTVSSPTGTSAKEILPTATPESATPSPTPSPTPTPTPAPAIMEVAVQTDKTRQTLLGLGGNYCQVMYTGKAFDAIGRHTLETLKPAYVRIPLPLNLWDPDKDATPRYRPDDPGVVELMTLLRGLREEYGVSHVIGSVWNAAPWMVESEDGGTGGIIPETLYQDTAESIIALLLHIREQTGVEIDQFSFNEPDIGVNVRMGSDKIVAFIRVAGPLFEKAGLNTKFLVGDVSQPSPTTQYVDTLLGAADISQWLGDISYHSWNSSTMSDGLLDAIRQKAAETDKTLVIGEFGYNPGLWKTPEEFTTWQNGWFVANTLYRNIKFAGAQLILYWQLQDNYPLLSPTLEPYPAWHMLLQTFEALRPGMTVVESQSKNESQLGTLAAIGEDGSFSLILLNKSPKDLSAVVAGAPEKPLLAVISKEGRYQEPFGECLPEGGTHTLVIPTKSYVTLTWRP